MPEVAQATITVTPVMAGAQEKITTDLTGAATPAGQKAGSAAGSSMLKSLGDKMSGAGTTMTKYMTGPVTAVGAAAGHAWKEVDTGLDTIVKKTGASGEALEEMRTSLNNITTSIPVDFDTAGAAIGEVNTRFGLTGQELEDLSAQFVKFAKLNDTDVVSSVDSVQKALSAYGLGADEAGALLDRLNKTSQETGVGVDTLTTGLIQNGTALQELGLDIDQSVALMGELEKSGANGETVMQGLRKALKSAAKDGKPLNEALVELQDAIENGTDDMDGLTKAYEVFGKSGDQIYGAVKNGSLDFRNLGEEASDAAGSVSDTFDETLSPMDEWTMTLNELAQSVLLVSNLLSAMAAMHEMGMPLADIIARADSIPQVEGRMEIIDEGQDFMAIVDYAHTPDGYEKIFQFAREIAGKDGHIYAGFGCPGKRDIEKRPVMGEIAGRYCDGIVLTLEDPRDADPAEVARELAVGVERAGCPYQVILDREEAIGALLDMANTGDVVLILGKGDEPYMYMEEGRAPWDGDHIVMRRQLKKRLG